MSGQTTIAFGQRGWIRQPGGGSIRFGGAPGIECSSVVSSEIVDRGNEIHFRVEASHFLWKMVRRLVGTLVEVGRGNLDEAAVARLLRERSARPAAWTAPPSGLFLEKVQY